MISLSCTSTSRGTTAAANAARVRKLFIDALGPDRAEALRKAYEDAIAAIEGHQRAECPPEGQGSQWLGVSRH